MVVVIEMCIILYYVLFCVVLWCVVLCCVVLCSIVLCCVALCCPLYILFSAVTHNPLPYQIFVGLVRHWYDM
jgi:hypothetical protein